MVYGDAILKKVSSDRSISTYSFLNGTKLLKLLSEGAFLSVPCKAAVGISSAKVCLALSTWTMRGRSRGGNVPNKELRHVDGRVICLVPCREIAELSVCLTS